MNAAKFRLLIRRRHPLLAIWQNVCLDLSGPYAAKFLIIFTVADLFRVRILSALGRLALKKRIIFVLKRVKNLATYIEDVDTLSQPDIIVL